ncbi:hypothetical protein RB620_01030 [Paenibacillus sp. LHD-117]|uniref:hypothetical protein n=1 Tax=Paenibacillus sp. LHD-117 TaxID=3071412 RepID=UPI0027E163AF|nr:hypothetical protein [Paenibacillus sp. LHD-117]MDQ6418008.1 hypothetical protein [Paenibacillus sp. LHD-117]
MGVNFTALFDYSINISMLQSLPMLLNEKSNFQYLFNVASSLDDVLINNWEWPQDIVRHRSIEEEFEEEGFVSIAGPGGIVLYFGNHLCELSSPIRWKAFLSDQLVQEKVIKISLEFSKIFGLPLYAPDYFCLSSFLFDGNNMDDVKQYLIRKYGDAANTINEMWNDLKSSSEYKKYYFETLKS